MKKGVSWWAFAAVIGLSGLDLAAAWMAKEYSLRPRVVLMAAGLVTSAALFVVYVKSLSYGDLWIVTFGWVALLQVGVVLVDRVRFGTSLSIRHVVLIAVLIVAQILLLTAPSGEGAPLSQESAVSSPGRCGSRGRCGNVVLPHGDDR